MFFMIAHSLFSCKREKRKKPAHSLYSPARAGAVEKGGKVVDIKSLIFIKNRISAQKAGNYLLRFSDRCATIYTDNSGDSSAPQLEGGPALTVGNRIKEEQL